MEHLSEMMPDYNGRSNPQQTLFGLCKVPHVFINVPLILAHGESVAAILVHELQHVHNHFTRNLIAKDPVRDEAEARQTQFAFQEKPRNRPLTRQYLREVSASL